LVKKKKKKKKKERKRLLQRRREGWLKVSCELEKHGKAEEPKLRSGNGWLKGGKGSVERELCVERRKKGKGWLREGKVEETNLTTGRKITHHPTTSKF
jgi:hypothetical protein